MMLLAVLAERLPRVPRYVGARPSISRSEVIMGAGFFHIRIVSVANIHRFGL